jgi:hypothetical protein
MNKKIQIILLTIIISLVSCGKNEKKNDKYVIKNEKAITDLNKKYNAIPWQPSEGDFTYELQEMFIDKKKLISLNDDIKNITKLDTTYLLSFYDDNIDLDYPDLRRNYIVQISISKDKFKELEKKIKSKNHSTSGCYIIKASKISTRLPALTSEIESGEEHSNSNLSYAYVETLIILKGELVDFYLEENENTMDK